MTVSQHKNLVLGAAVGYTEEQIAPFLISLRRSGYVGDIILFVEPAAAKRFQGMAQFEGVTLLAASQWAPIRFRLFKRAWALRYIWRPAQMVMWAMTRLMGKLPLKASLRIRAQIPLALQVFPPTEGRFLRYYRLLVSQPYSRVLLSDVRDVLFQNDPFIHLPDQGLAVSIEPRLYTVATEPWNANWVRQLYGQEMLNQIGDKPVSCSGVTYGDSVSMVHYLRLMAEHILKLNARATRHGWFDQAIHNVVLWIGQAGEPAYLETLASPVATLGQVHESTLQLDGEGKVLNLDGTVVSIVHQYDRCPQLRDKLLRTLDSESVQLVSFHEI